MEHSSLPLPAAFRNVQRTGRWQQAPQLLHSPVRSLATGRIEVNVLSILWRMAFHLFSRELLSVIIYSKPFELAFSIYVVTGFNQIGIIK